MASVLRSAPGRLVTAADPDGQALAKAVVVQRTGWACDLVAQMTATTLKAHWTHGDIDRITRPDATGKPLPAFAYKALERLGWTVRAPEGVWVCSRLRRIAAEHAGRLVRAAAHRQALIRVLASAWPKKVSWNDLPEGTYPVLLRNVRRQLCTYAAEHGVPADAGPDGMPATLPEVQPEPPIVPGQLLLAVTDRQFATIRARPPAGCDPGRNPLSLAAACP